VTNEQALRLASRTARQLRKARAVKAAILVAAAGAVLQAWGRLLPGIGPEANTVIIMAAVVVWVILSAVGAVGGRLINAAAGYSGAGRIDLAEQALTEAAGRFSLFPAHQLLALQNLAALAHGAGQYAQVTVLSRLLVEQSGRSRGLRRAFERSGRLLLADGELMLGRLHEAYEQLSVLYAGKHTLAERLTLLPVACYYEAAVQSWDHLISQVADRARLAHLLPPAQAASTLACLALGCQQTGQLHRRDWLWQQATLLVDRDELVSRLPILAALSPESAIRLPWQRQASDSGETE
jgi:hypothetical protein